VRALLEHRHLQAGTRGHHCRSGSAGSAADDQKVPVLHGRQRASELALARRPAGVESVTAVGSRRQAVRHSFVGLVAVER
jgi:hypothetical protein